ncbi:hypothetical protein C8A03DRAFT_30667 [Achaetomium macrosporum]|uniref:Transcription factor domain-containing protein n=1 Tax=Achaetomium macrosporum TaxID=79813 RepID=A0AAN7CFM9_9PEZI|nr:hypothetical protein C8A03DRAFT_30667 [Achaetomium macrosporum]
MRSLHPRQRIRRPRKTTMAWVANRVSTLEKLLPAVSSASSSSTPKAGGRGVPLSASRTPSGGPITGTPGETEQFFGEEILVQKGSQSQSFNEPLHSRMIEQQKEIQFVLTTPPSNNRQETPQLPSIYNPMGILSTAVPSQPSYSFFPSKQTALKLWNVYLEKIEACSGIKVLHIPTDEARLCAAMESPADAQPEDLALLWCNRGYPATVQARCKTGFEQALTEAEVLDKPRLPLLCALALYLSALQLHNRGKGIWVLNGLAIRIAQGMGLHPAGGVDVLDLTLQMWNDEMLKPYSWLWKTNREYHVVMYLLWHLCVRPPEGGPTAERAWSMVDRWFAENREIIDGEGGSGNKGAILAALKRKAVLIRESTHSGREATTRSEGRGRRDDTGGDADREGQPANDAPVVLNDQEQQPPPAGCEDTWVSLRRMSMGVGVENEAWTSDLNQVPDRGAFIQAFQFDGQDLAGMAW